MDPVTNESQKKDRINKLISEIHSLYKKEKILRFNADSSKEILNLHIEAFYLFGSWKNAIRAAGYNPREVGLYNEWMKQTLIDRILDSERRTINDGQRANITASAMRHFGNLENAILAAGATGMAFKGPTIKEQKARAKEALVLKNAAKQIILEQKKMLRRQKKEIFTDLKIFKNRYGKLCIEQILEQRPDIPKMAEKYCGGWEVALKNAGIGPRKNKWTKETISLEIRRLLKMGKRPTSAAYIVKKNANLYSAAKRVFGSWAEAVRASGLEYISAREHKKSHCTLTREKVLAEIKELAINGLLERGCRISKGHPKLYYAAIKHFGSWNKARTIVFESCGIECKGQNKKWTKETLLMEIRKFFERKNSLNTLEARRIEVKLQGAARKLQYKLWADAVEAAGVVRVRKNGVKARESLTCRIRELAGQSEGRL